MRAQFSVVSQSVAVDRFTNRLSLFNIIEAFQAPRFPLLIPEVVIVSFVRRDENEPNVFETDLVVNLNGNRIGMSHLHVNFEGRLYVRLIANFQNLPVLTAGDLEFTIPLPNGDPIRTSIPVIQIPVAPVPVVPVQAVRH
ncbi:MAG: hypothetical protein WBQ43_12410 [Terriglobales bacterium]